jgi:hypothetical protein
MSNFSPTWFALFGVICFSSIFILVGVGVIIFTLRNRKKSQASISWPTANGVVVRSQISTSSSEDSDGYTTTTYSPEVVYEYTASGQTFQGKRISYDTLSSTSKKNAEKITGKYQVGVPVTVSYDPQNPQESVLERRVASLTGGIIFSAIFIVIGLCVCVLVPIFLFRLLNLG